MQRTDYRTGDVLRMKKKHPCGSDLWKVLRVGADIRLECCGCGRQVMLSRSETDKRVKSIVAEQ